MSYILIPSRRPAIRTGPTVVVEEPPPEPGSVIPTFACDWTQGTPSPTGTSVSAKSNGGQLSISFSQDNTNVGEIFAPSDVGWPTNVGNILRVTPNASQTALRLTRTNLTTITGVDGMDLYIRFMAQYIGPHTAGDPSNHWIEANNSGTIPWSFRTRTGGEPGTGNPLIFHHEWNFSGHGYYFLNQQFTIGAAPILRYELHIGFRPGNVCVVESNVFDTNNVQLYDSSDWLRGGGGPQTPLSVASGSINVARNANLQGILIGCAGLSDNPQVPMMYQACPAISLDDWCGPYGNLTDESFP